MARGPAEAMEAIEHFIGRRCSYMKVKSGTGYLLYQLLLSMTSCK